MLKKFHIQFLGCKLDILFWVTLAPSRKFWYTITSIVHWNLLLFCYRVLVMGDGEVLEFDCPDVLLQNKESHFYKLAHQEFH
jgi:hypothetical protein